MEVRLTPAEFRVMIQVTNCLTCQESADRLLISEGTLKRHLTHIYDKTGVSNKIELMLYAMEKGWLSSK